MKDRVNLSEWKRAAAEQQFRALEDEFWHEYWPDPPESFDVDTHIGPTRAYRWAGTGEPIVFLHGVGGSAITWTGYVNGLDGRTVYAIDTIGDLGRSRQLVPMKDAADLAQWLDEVLDGLRLERVHLAGTSYGGFLSLNQAARMPDRVQSIALFDPVGIAPVRLMRFLVWGLAVGLASLLPARLRRIAARKLRMPLVEDKPMMRLVRMGQMKHRTRLVRPQPLTDDQLRSIAIPVLLLVAEKSEVFAPVAVRDRAVSLLPDVDAELVAGAGHALTVSHTDHVVTRLAEFLRLHSPATST